MNINLKNKSLITFIIIAFYEIFIKFTNTFNPFKVTYRQLLWQCPSIYIIYIPIFKLWQFLILIIIFHILIISICISINRVTYFTSNAFSTITSISLLIILILLQSLLMALAMLILELKEILQDLDDKFFTFF